MKQHLYQAGLLSVVLLAAPTAGNALTIHLNNIGGVTAGSQAEQGFQAATHLWESLFTDPVTVYLDVGFSTLGSTTLGQTSSTEYLFNYGSVRNALTFDKTSADDNTATAHLPGTSSGFPLLINYTSNNPNGAGSAVPYVDNNNNANNQIVDMTSANAKALGWTPSVSTATDASITFNNLFNWDFNFSRAGAIAAGKFDFVGIAAHEIGHALGFISGVDILDQNSSGTFYPDYQFDYVAPLDLFRYSDLSKTNHLIDWTADNRTKYFSIDGGVTSIAQFATGVIHGDGRQASHWKDGQGLGIMDPTSAPGELLKITQNDIRAMDVIGWNLNSVPEPGTLALLLSGLMGFRVMERQKRSANT